MKYLVSGLALFVILIVLIWRLMGNKAPLSPVQEQEQSQGASPVEATIAASATIAAATPTLTGAPTHAGSPKNLEAKLILRASPDQVKVSPEAGGHGPTSFLVGHNNEIYFADRFNDRVVEITPDGGERVIYKSNPDDYIRGHGVDRDGNSFVLVGNDVYSLMKVGPNGKAEKMNFSYKPEHLNGMRVDARDNAVYLVGVDKTLRVDKTTGEQTEVYGVPGYGAEEALDVTLTEAGEPSLTFRALDGAPVKTVKLEGEKVGSVLGTYPQENGNFVIAFESDPSLSEENAQNPKVKLKTVNSNGEVVGESEIPLLIEEDTYSVDLSLNVGPGGRIHQLQSNKEGTEVYEYAAP